MRIAEKKVEMINCYLTASEINNPVGKKIIFQKRGMKGATAGKIEGVCVRIKESQQLHLILSNGCSVGEGTAVIAVEIGCYFSKNF